MANDLFDLFRDKLKTKNGLVASDPQTLDSLAESEEEQDLIVESIEGLETTELKIDYSSFENFVFFNSSLDYFNITGEKILNDYPIDGTVDAIKRFEKDLDGYQKYALSQWPSHAGHLRFNTAVSSSYIIVEDVGQDTEGGAYRAGILSPGTGSVSLEVWVDAEAAITGIGLNNFTRLSKGKGGRPPYDYVLMFKIVILQRYYNLSDEQVEYQINDRMSFMRFLDLTIADDVPDSRTVWNFREQLTDLEIIEPLFDLFLKELDTLGLVVNEGKIIDASFVEVPRQRNSRDDNKKIKNNEIPEDWKDKPRKLSQKDTEAR